MEVLLLLLPLLVLSLFFSTSAAGEVNTIHPGCPSACGDVAVPYPFGIGANCSISSGFDLVCKRNMSGHYKPFAPSDIPSDMEIISINLTSGWVSVYHPVSSACYNTSTDKMDFDTRQLDIGTELNYRISYTLNEFTTVGSNTLAYIQGFSNDLGYSVAYQIGCLSVGWNADTIAGVSSCSGLGCCQTSIPKGLSDFFGIQFDERFNNSEIWNFSKCGYAFLIKEGSFVFDTKYITTDALHTSNDGRVPLVLDWAIGQDGCETVRANNLSACLSEHSHCVNSTNGPGYLCACSRGYQGNPYLIHGCQDINECDHPEDNQCYGTCFNLVGSFRCTCPSGTEGDPGKQEGCRKRSKKFPLWLGFIIGLICTIVLATFAHLVYERVKLIRAKRKCFQQNGGLLLQEQINAHQGVKFKIFTIEEIERATDNFDRSRVLGEGGHGLVYKGSLADDREVAIKRSLIADQKQKKEFAKEMYIGSLINHRNVVNILGCCLEVEVPLLVYEFAPNGDLFNYIHIEKGPISLDFRLKVAGESAAALAYLHSDASPPILHGDVKSSNILLDEGYTPKVSDFGTSLLDIDQLATHAQGTLGYIDPEYAQTCLLTDKSDVYSFAVVLLEVFTRKRVVLSDQSGTKIGLVSVFLSSARENRFRELLDSEIRHELGNAQVEEMAEILTRCLNPSGESRPAMKEVAAWLERFRKCIRPSSSSKTNDLKLNEGNEMKYGESSSFWTEDSTIHTSTKSLMTFSISSERY